MMIPVGRKPGTVKEVVELLHGTLAALDANLLKSFEGTRMGGSEEDIAKWQARKLLVRDLIAALS